MKRHTPEHDAGPVRVVAAGSPASIALRDAIDAAKAGDSMAAVTVVPPSTMAGLSLRRQMAAGDGLFNVQFMVVGRLVELLGAPALAERRLRPLTPEVYYRMIGRALNAGGGPLRRAAGHPVALLALASRLTELRQADTDTLAALGRAGGTAEALVALGKEVRRRMHGYYYDVEDLARAAASAVEGGSPSLGDIGQAIIYLPEGMSPGYRALLAALRRQDRLTVIVAMTGDDDADRPAADLLRILDAIAAPTRPPKVPSASGDGSVVRPPAVSGGAGEGPAARQPVVSELPPISRLIVAPDPDLEVRAVARELYARMKSGTALHRIAVLYRSPEPYARLLEEHLTSCGLPVAGPGTATLGQSVSGRTLLGLLDLPARDFSRQAVMALCNAAPIRLGPGGGPLPVKDWEELSREANIVAGPRRWASRLNHLGAGLRRRAEDAVARGDDPVRYRRRAGQVEALAVWLATLVERCAAPPSPGWGERARWVASLLVDYLDVTALDAGEVDAHCRVLDVLEAMTLLADDDPEVVPDLYDDGPGAFAVALELSLSERQSRRAPVGGGVYVGPVASAAGASFDLVVVVGMAEGDFPPRRLDDPLLPDRVRLHAGTGMGGRGRRRDEERRAFVSALYAAPVRILTAPRSDQRTFQPRLPARWFVQAAGALAGHPVGADDLARSRPDWPWLVAVDSLPASVATGAGDETEWMLGSLGRWAHSGRGPLAHPQVRARPALARGLAAVAERSVGALSAWEGLVGPHPLLAIDPARPLSPTSLQRWAECPRRYFLDSVLHVRETLRPEEMLRLNALDRGTLVHDALERFFREKAAGSDMGQPWTEGDSTRLLEIVEQGCDEVEAQGLTGKPVLWAMQRQVLLDELARFLARDFDHRSARGLVPTSFEVSFGGAEDEIGPVSFSTGRRTLRFKGRIDRIDVTADGAAVEVIDYKTGGADRFATIDRDCVDEGKLLQLPVYALAASQAYPSVSVSASYWFVTDSDSRHQHKEVPLTEENRARFGQVIGHIADGIEDGVFPGNPGKEDRDSWANCRYCPYDRVCPTQRDEVWERVVLSEGAGSYASLRPVSTAGSQGRA